LYWVINQCIGQIETQKFGYFRARIADKQYLNAWLLYLGFMVVLVWSAIVIVLWAPMAGGGGVPEVISFLNGSRPKGLFDLKTGFAKSVALVLAVSSGLAIGYVLQFILFHISCLMPVRCFWLHILFWLHIISGCTLFLVTPVA